MAKTLPFWFIRDGAKLIQCSKDDFDKAITEGKSVKYMCCADKKNRPHRRKARGVKNDALVKIGLAH